MRDEKGLALIVTFGLLFLITLLGLSAFRWSLDELQMAAHQKSGIQARYIAESGIGLVLQWFQEPESFPAIGEFGRGGLEDGRGMFLGKRLVDSRGRPSFFSGTGESQFTGSEADPDFGYEWEPGGSKLMEDTFDGLGGITGLKLFAPKTPGAVATLQAAGTSASGIRRTVQTQIAPSPIPPISEAVNIGDGLNGPVPVLAHWGDVVIHGNADLGESLFPIPQKDQSAPAGGEPYGPSNRRDAWIDYYIGGAILKPSSAGCPGCREPFLAEGYGHLHQFLAGPGRLLSVDEWNYPALKAFARTWGYYFTTDLEGRLIQEEVGGVGATLSPGPTLAALTREDHFPLVFIDTTDGKPPRADNQATVELPMDFLQGIFVIQANVVLRGSGAGRTIAASPPPPELSGGGFGSVAVNLSGIHLRGLLYVSGRLVVEGSPRIFGGVVVGQDISGPGLVEVWFDDGLRRGVIPGLPVVTVQKGGWYLR